MRSVGRAIRGAATRARRWSRRLRALPVTVERRDRSDYLEFHPDPRRPHLELGLRLDFAAAQARTYKYSKLYYTTPEHEDFDEQRVVCFEVPRLRRIEVVRIALPDEARRAHLLRLRIDGLPYTEGDSALLHARMVTTESDPECSRLAESRRRRQWVREQVLVSERERRARLPHYPESVSLELVAGCNLRCPHCSSHGIGELHRHHNSLPEMAPELLETIAGELFPHVTALSLVGRGEPTFTSDALWDRCMTLVQHHGVKISCVTNGTLLERRFRPDVIPYVDELCVSLDGGTRETVRINRGGADLDVILRNVSYYHEQRTSLDLARRPQLSVYWTLKANNVHELPGFIRDFARFDPDYFAIRHLVVFHERDREQSLVGKPELTNRFLAEAYAELESRGIRFEAPPLMKESDAGQVLPQAWKLADRERDDEERASSGESCGEDEGCMWMHRTAIIQAHGEVLTCGKHFSERVGQMEPQGRFWEIWNGPRMTSLRESFGTPGMWRQCRRCWLREIRWQSQRRAKDLRVAFASSRSATFTPAAWDYRDFELLEPRRDRP